MMSYASIIPFIIMFGFLVLIVTTLLRLQKNMAVRRQAEEDTTQAYEFVRTVLDSMNDSISIIDVNNFKVMGVNGAFLKEYGFRTEAEVIGRTCHEVTHGRPDMCTPPNDICPLADTIKTGRHTVAEHIHYTKEGDRVYVEIATSPIKDRAGNIIQVVHISRDISERKKAQEDIERSHRELAQLAADLETKNSQMGEHRQRLLDTLDQLSALMRQVTEQKNYGAVFRNPNIRNCYEEMHCSKTDCPCHGKDGMRCWQIAGTYCGGKVQGAFAEKYKDCSKCPFFKRSTQDPIDTIGEHFNNMMHILFVQHKELEDAYTELKTAHSRILQQEKMASIGQLAAGVAHEINNPMGFIISNLGSFHKYTHRLLEFIEIQGKAVEDLVSCAADSGEKTTAIIKMLTEHKASRKIDLIKEDIANLIAESLDGAERVKKIVENLKSFSRLDEAEQKMADINSGIESTINIVWNELKYKVSLKKEYGKLPQTLCNPGELNQVFMNILVNAAHAIEKQGEITVKTRSEGEDIYVAISDTGCGIPGDKLNRIFEPFFTTKEVGKGTGLGLSIAYDIIKKHNGEIRVESEVGRGTTFTIKLPVVEK